MSSTQELQWLLTRKSSSYLVKQKGLARVFSREPANLAQIHSYKHSGLVNDKSIAVQPNADGKGVVLSTKRSKAKPNQIAGRRSTQIIKKGGSRHAAGAVAKVTASQRPDLTKDAVARASAICRSQRPSGRKQPPARKTRGNKNKVLLA